MYSYTQASPLVDKIILVTQNMYINERLLTVENKVSVVNVFTIV